MSAHLLEAIVARKKNDPPADTRDRIDLRAERAWVARVERQAERFGVSLSAYIRQAVSKQLELDEATDPGAKDDCSGP